MPLTEIKTSPKYNKQQIAACNELLPQQVSMAWDETRQIKVSKSYAQVENVVFIGMGGSALGADLIKSVFVDRLKVPFEIVRNYTVPKYTSSKSLVILSSFSGTTEEVLLAAKEVKKRKAKLMVITAGGKLKSFAKREKIPAYIFEPGDLAVQPRFGLGFSMVGVLGLLERAELVRVTVREIELMKQAMNEVVDTSALDVGVKENPAKTVAHSLHNKAVIVVAAEHLMGNAHVLANQINEGGKRFALHLELPELNHHFLESLSLPKGFAGNFAFLMLRSELYHPRIQKRFEITADLFEEQGAEVIDYDAGGDTVVEECGEVLQFGAFVSCYLAMLAKVNPMDIPWVVKLKKRMTK